MVVDDGTLGTIVGGPGQARRRYRLERRRMVDEVGESGVDDRLARPGGVSYLHIPAVDARQSAVFYETVFGWNVTGHDTARPSFDDGTGHVSGAWMTNQARRLRTRPPALHLRLPSTTPSAGSRPTAARSSRPPTPRGRSGSPRSATPPAMCLGSGTTGRARGAGRGFSPPGEPAGRGRRKSA